MKLVESLLGAVHPILQIRESLGADTRHVFFITRAWTGRTAGEGTVTETVEELFPVPGIKEIRHQKRVVKEGGAATEGDLTIYHISKDTYPDEDLIARKSDAKNVERFYKVGDYFYEVIAVTERYLTWDVTLRRKTDQRAV